MSYAQSGRSGTCSASRVFPYHGYPTARASGLVAPGPVGPRDFVPVDVGSGRRWSHALLLGERMAEILRQLGVAEVAKTTLRKAIAVADWPAIWAAQPLRGNNRPPSIGPHPRRQGAATGWSLDGLEAVGRHSISRSLATWGGRPRRGNREARLDRHRDGIYRTLVFC